MASFPKISLRLTPEQLETLTIFRKAVKQGTQHGPNGDTRYAVMGNVWLSGASEGTADVYLIPAAQYKTINNAIAEAKKSLPEPKGEKV